MKIVFFWGVDFQRPKWQQDCGQEPQEKREIGPEMRASCSKPGFGVCAPARPENWKSRKNTSTNCEGRPEAKARKRWRRLKEFSSKFWRSEPILVILGFWYRLQNFEKSLSRLLPHIGTNFSKFWLSNFGGIAKLW